MRRAIHIGGASVYADGNGFRAVIPRTRGQGRIRKRFATLEEARAWIDANAHALAIREPITPIEAAEFREAAAMLPAGASLAEAAQALAASRATSTDARVREAVSAFLAAKREAGRRNDTLRDYASALARLPDCTFAELTTAAVTASLDGLKARRRNNVLATFRTFLGWSVASRYISADPSASIDKTTIDWIPPRIYTPAQTAMLFAIAEEEEPRLVPIMAVCAFAGVRSCGAVRLTAEAFDIGGKVIAVPGYADKMRRGYLAPVNETLEAWLGAYPFHGWTQSRQAYLVAFDRLVRHSGVPRIRNGFRHSFASYLYARTQDIRAVASAIGHFGEVETLLRSYRRLASPALADAYFAIRPLA